MKKNNLNNILIFCVSFLLIIAFTPTIIVKAQSQIPKPSDLKYINDYVNIIDYDIQDYIVSVGKELEDKTGSEMVVVVINSLEGRDIESYSNELFRKWGIGQKDKNNGILILVSIEDRKWRVEVGSGLEGVITDIYSSRVMEEFAKPNFKEGNYQEGIKNVYSIFADNIAEEYGVVLDKNIKIDQDQNSNNNDTSNEYSMIDIIIIIVFIITVIIFGGRGGPRGYGGYGSFGGFGGGSSGGGSSGGFGGGSSSGGGSSGSW